MALIKADTIATAVIVHIFVNSNVSIVIKSKLLESIVVLFILNPGINRSNEKSTPKISIVEVNQKVIGFLFTVRNLRRGAYNIIAKAKMDPDKNQYKGCSGRTTPLNLLVTKEKTSIYKNNE